MNEDLVTKKDLVIAKEDIEKEIGHKLGKLRAQRLEDINVLRAERKSDMDAIMAVLKPMSDTYVAAAKMGKWGMALLVFVSVLIGVLIEIGNLLKIHITNIR